MEARHFSCAALAVFALLLSVPSNAQSFMRGINVNPWFTRPAMDRQGKYADPPFPVADAASYRSDLEKIKDTGFDYVRLPVNVAPLVHDPEERRRATLLNIRRVVQTALDVGLNVVFEYHAISPGSTYAKLVDDASLTASYLTLMQETARDVVALDDGRILLETLNEPTSACDDKAWPMLQQKIVAAVHATAPNVKLVLTGACWSNMEGLPTFDLGSYGLDKTNLYATFHYYKPFWFTHQGATWVGSRSGMRPLRHVPWPPRRGSLQQSEASLVTMNADALDVAQARTNLKNYYAWSPDETSVDADFAKIARWADSQGLPHGHLLLGEFGVLKDERKWSGAEIDSAARWLFTVRTAAETHGFPWAMWSYKEGMALTTTESGSAYYPEIVRALGLRTVP